MVKDIRVAGTCLLGAKSNDSSVWDGIVERYQNRLSGRGSRNLSSGAKLFLINAVLSGSPTYLFSLFKAPKSVVKDLERYQRRFLWNGKSEGNKMALMDWKLCKMPVKKGGLGIHDLKLSNDVILSKWLWRFAVERGSWWQGLINYKYPNEVSCWQTKRERSGFSKSVWANISKGYDQFWNFAAIDLGNGTQVSFLYDCWIPRIVLAASFPRVAAAVLDPEALLSDTANIHGDLVSWNLDFKYILRGGAARERDDFMNLLNSVNLAYSSHSPCRIIWKQEANSNFSVISLYRELEDIHLRGIEDFPVEKVWISWIPSKICFFIWLVYHNRVLTLDNLKKRGFYLANKCVLCMKDEETAHHMLVECKYVRNIWSMMYCRRSRVPRWNGEIDQVIANWPTAYGDWIEKWFDGCILHSIWWAVWLERNQRTFEDKATSMMVVGKKAARH
ncbi:unnamed protein product [Linum trigynum]|uniref:Reverse transcriptase zinc-binding domain-containing protein n=1 Tax=Linum trigynum TaxID=586398 RepID=A0AAV2CLH6_9ROSI